MGECLARALALLERRDRGRAELADELSAAGFVEAEIAAGLAKLEAWGFVSDERVALALVRRRSGRLARGNAALRAELEARGLPEAAIALALSGAPDELERARTLLTKRFPRGVEPARAARLLLARGFEPDIVESVVGADDFARDGVEGG